jgi:DNA end-binding protein Ku
VASDDIALAEFVPIAAVDPLYVDASYYLAPDKGGERAYRLFRDALEHAGIAGIATYAARGKQYVVMLRPFEDGLVMHSLRYPDEVKPWREIPIDKLPAPPRAELTLAGQVIDSLRHEAFEPDRYTDEVKGRVRKLIAQKAKGGEITVPEPAAPAAPIIDLMAALKASLTGKADGTAKAEGAGSNGHRRHARAAGSTRRRPHAGRARAGARRASAHH